MRKLFMLTLAFALMSIVLFSCSSQSDGELIKISVSKSSETGTVNPHSLVVFEDKPTLKAFDHVITNSVKRNGIVDIGTPDFDFEVTYSNGNKQGFHLWLGERGQKSTLMHVIDTHTIYTISDEMTNKLIDLLGNNAPTTGWINRIY